MRRCEKPLDGLRVSVRRRVREKSVEFRDGRRQSSEVEMQPAKQGDSIGLRRRLQSFAIEAGKNKRINRVPHPLRITHLRHGRLDGRLERPVSSRINSRDFRPIGPLVDPGTKCCDLFAR